jgi:hypothetical protein
MDYIKKSEMKMGCIKGKCDVEIEKLLPFARIHEEYFNIIALTKCDMDFWDIVDTTRRSLITKDEFKNLKIIKSPFLTYDLYSRMCDEVF